MQTNKGLEINAEIFSRPLIGELQYVPKNETYLGHIYVRCMVCPMLIY